MRQLRAKEDELRKEKNLRLKAELLLQEQQSSPSAKVPVFELWEHMGELTLTKINIDSADWAGDERFIDTGPGSEAGGVAHRTHT